MIQINQTKNTLVFVISVETDLNVQSPFISAIKEAVMNKIPAKNITLRYNGVYISTSKQTALQAKFKAIKDKVIEEVKPKRKSVKTEDLPLKLKRKEGETETQYLDRLARKAAKEFLQ